jgi:hypothetical protein
VGMVESAPCLCGSEKVIRKLYGVKLKRMEFESYLIVFYFWLFIEGKIVTF